MKIIKRLKDKIHSFLNDEKLKHELYVILFQSNTREGKLFDIILFSSILVSIILVAVESLDSLPAYLSTPFIVMEYIFTAFFTIEYLTRIYCSPRPHRYIFSFYGVIDLLATLPLYLGFFFPGARYLLIFRAFRLTRIFRVFRLFKYTSAGDRLALAIKDSSKKLAVFFMFIVILVIFIGTMMYMIESTTSNTQFDNIPNSIYWAIVTMTTVGYGDITPVTGFGKFLSACVMLIGYTIIAVPTGIVSVSMMKNHKEQMDKECPNCHQKGHDENAKYCKNCGHDLQPKSDEQNKEQQNDDKQKDS